jgi:hypothetical protein
MQRLLASLVSLCVLAGTALAHPPPPPDPEEYEAPSEKPTLVEWSTWIRLGVAVATGEAPSTTVARTTTPPAHEADRRFAGALGAGVSLPLGSKARIGAWVEVRGWEVPIVGGELLLIPGDLDMFFYKGKSAISLRAGGNPDIATGQLGFYYRAPWDLFGSRPRSSRYMIGVGVVATATQSRLDSHDWSATVGLEFEPVGALRYLLGIRSWY